MGICNRKKVIQNGNKNIQGFIKKNSKCYRRGHQVRKKKTPFAIGSKSHKIQRLT